MEWIWLELKWLVVSKRNFEFCLLECFDEILGYILFSGREWNYLYWELWLFFLEYLFKNINNLYNVYIMDDVVLIFNVFIFVFINNFIILF